MDQLRAAVRMQRPGDKNGEDIARFFLQEMARRDRAEALRTFEAWKKGRV